MSAPNNTNGWPAKPTSAWATIFWAPLALLGRSLRQLGKPGMWLEAYALKRLGEWPAAD